MMFDKLERVGLCVVLVVGVQAEKLFITIWELRRSGSTAYSQPPSFESLP